MQSMETRKALAHVDHELIETRIQNLLEVRSANKLRAMLEHAAEEIATGWLSPIRVRCGARPMWRRR